MNNYMDRFRIKDKAVIITGAAGLLGEMHAIAVLEAEGHPILLDINNEKLNEVYTRLHERYPDLKISFYAVDITSKQELLLVRDQLQENKVLLYGLINNASNNPTMNDSKASNGRFEEFSLDEWEKDLNIGLKGAFLCSQVFVEEMKSNGDGAIINIASDLALIAPDQRIYEKDGVQKNLQAKKPVTYSVVKAGLVGLTKYLATYYAEFGIRANAVAFGGVSNYQDSKFVKKLTQLIPLGRMAERDEYICSIIYILSEGSSYMTGTVVTIDGGRTCW